MCYVSASYQFNYEEKGKVLLAARYVKETEYTERDREIYRKGTKRDTEKETKRDTEK